MDNWLSNTGNVDDIRCSLMHTCIPEKPSEIRRDIEWFNRNMNYEVAHKNRSSVVSLFKGRIRKLEKKLTESGAMIGRSSIYK